MTKKITIRKGQLGLLSRQGDYYQVLEAGEHRLPWFNVPEVLIVNRDGSEVPEALAEYLRRFQPEWIERYCLGGGFDGCRGRGAVCQRCAAGNFTAFDAPTVLVRR